MEAIDRILACSARVFGLPPPHSRSALPSRGAVRADPDGIDEGAFECCAAEGLDAGALLEAALLLRSAETADPPRHCHETVIVAP